MNTQTKHTPGFALVALLEQLRQWKNGGAQEIYFGCLASHPETDEGCTFGDLIEPAAAEFEGLKQWGVASTDQALHEAAPQMLSMLRALSQIFNASNFTDRAGYGPSIDALIAKAEGN